MIFRYVPALRGIGFSGYKISAYIHLSKIKVKEGNTIMYGFALNPPTLNPKPLEPPSLKTDVHMPISEEAPPGQLRGPPGAACIV